MPSLQPTDEGNIFFFFFRDLGILRRHACCTCVSDNDRQQIEIRRAMLSPVISLKVESFIFFSCNRILTKHSCTRHGSMVPALQPPVPKWPAEVPCSWWHGH